MNRKQPNQDEGFLPPGLLEDDDLPTTSSNKHSSKSQKDFAFSAPPILFNLGYRIEEDFFDEQSWQVIKNFSSPQKEYKKQKSEFYQETLLANNTRKLSLQNEEQYRSYQSYQNISMPELVYMPTYSPQDQILTQVQYAVEWSKDQYGSRTIQKALESGSEHLKNKIFENLVIELPMLTRDKFANYVIQKYLEIGTQDHKEIIFEYAKKQFLYLSLHSFGCRVIQKLVEYSPFNISVKVEILKLVDGYGQQLMLNQNGNHVIQKMLQVYQQMQMSHIVKLIILNIETLSFNAFGCRVVQKYLQCSQIEQNSKIVMNKLVSLTVRLSQCQYGNYIMQYIVTNCKQYQEEIFKIFNKHFIELSCNKFASNVLEKVIKCAPTWFKEEIMAKVIINDEFIHLSKNQFGNYVIQSLIECSPKERRAQLRLKLKQRCQQISKTQYGRHVLMQMQKYR